MADGQVATEEQDVESKRPKQIMKRERENKQPNAADCIDDQMAQEPDTLEERKPQGDKPKRIKKRKIPKLKKKAKNHHFNHFYLYN